MKQPVANIPLVSPAAKPSPFKQGFSQGFLWEGLAEISFSKGDVSIFPL
jgi:hypothetical protein